MMFCRFEGNFRHKVGNRERNYITGTKRDALKEKLKYRKAGKVAAVLNRATNVDEVLCGNATSLHGTKVLAQIRHEVCKHTYMSAIHSATAWFGFLFVGALKKRSRQTSFR